MGIDIYARWRGQTDAERQAQEEAWLSTTSGHVGYLREAYHGEPYATRHLCKEAFTHGEHPSHLCDVSLGSMPSKHHRNKIMT